MSELILLNGRKGSGELKPKCTVNIDNKVETFNDFVVVGFNQKTGNIATIHNADVITLAIALELIKQAFVVAYEKQSPEEKKIVDTYIENMRGEVHE